MQHRQDDVALRTGARDYAFASPPCPDTAVDLIQAGYSGINALDFIGMESYGQFCPVAKAMEILGERWTLLIVREIIAGSHRFNELRHGNPLISPSLLSQRLKTLESAGLVEKRARGASFEYHLTMAGRELEPIIVQLGIWGQRWTASQLTGDDYDPALLMWDVRRNIRVDRVPSERAVVRFEFYDAPARTRFWWLVVNGGAVDLCLKRPGYEEDLEVRTSVPVMVEIWMGRDRLMQRVKAGEVEVRGDRALARGLAGWLGYNPFARMEN